METALPKEAEVVIIGGGIMGCATAFYLAKRGVVLRCLPCGDGYRVAIQFESLLAA